MKELSFSYQPATDAPRQAFRASMPGLAAKVAPDGDMHDVHDVSAGGLSLEDSKRSLALGLTLTLDLHLKGRVIITGLQAEVARHEKDLTGLKFTNLSRKQEEHLDKLVLEVQKHHISKSKNAGSHFDDDPKT